MNPPSSSPQSPGPGAARGAPPPPVHAKPVRTARDVWNMFRERWPWGALAGVVAGGAVALAQLVEPGLYTASTTVEIRLPPAAGGPGPWMAGGGVDLPFHLERLRSATFRAYVAHALTPQESERIRAAWADPELPAAEQRSVDSILEQAVAVSARAGASIVEIAATHRDASAAELIANRYARRYVDFNLDQAANASSSGTVLLDDEEAKLRLQLQDAQARLQAYREQNDTAGLAGRQSAAAQRLEAVGRQTVEARAEATKLESTLAQVDALERAGRSVLESGYVASYGSVAALLRELDQIKAERAVLEERYLEMHPKMLANARSIEAKTALLAENMRRAVTELRNGLDRAREHERRLLDQRAALDQESRGLEQAALGFDVLQKEVKAIIAQLYDELPRRRKEMALAGGAASPTVRPLDKAVAPTRPSWPDRRVVAGTAAAAGLLLFLAVPLIVGMVDVRLKAAWEVEQFLGQNLLGEVPALSGIHKKDRPHLMAKGLDHAASEAFRGMFGQYQLNSGAAYPKVVMLTSTLPGEGKSMIANNLAATFAAHGKKTLLVDGDLRRPNLHLFFGRDNACGLLRWMAAETPVPEAVASDADLGILEIKPGLYLLRSGGEDRQATELFEMPRFRELFEALRRQFDLVLVDTPPLGVFPDGLLVSKYCDEVVYVCRFNAVPRSKIRKTIERLGRSTATLVGIVLNGIPSGKQSAYYDYYGYGSTENKRYKAYYAQKR